ncbi:hypothetical protein KSP39_PZI011382 [Platanthera zijinensis]|uniref:C2 domain-containing protein n=1 Tax=Platanthera zijinensis TaxID=2320716 RepID=A0AAP0BGV4_9ASPA
MQETLNKAPPMDTRSILLTSISCKGVKYFALFQKPSVYAVVSIAGGDDPKKQKHKTSPDHEGGENPEWDQAAMLFDLEHADFKELFLEFRIMAKGNLLGDKLIGKSRALISDLVEGNPSGVVRHVSYQVGSSDGKPNGVLSFSYKLNLPEMEIRLPVAPLDPMIPSPPLKDYYPPPPATESLYPPLPLLEDSPVDYFYYRNQRSPPDPIRYYTPPPPPPQHSVGYYYPPSERAVYIPVSARDAGYLSGTGSVSSNREYYPPPPAELPPPPMPASGTYYPPSATGYAHPPYPQDSCCYCNCTRN